MESEVLVGNVGRYAGWIVTTLAAASLAGGCSSSSASASPGHDGGKPNGDAGHHDATAVCGSSGEACCANASCGGGLTCTGDRCVSSGKGETGAPGTGGTGSPCVRSADCAGGACLALGNGSGVCTSTCVTSTTCVAGWVCGAESGQTANICKCTPSPEGCDGKDNDCNGVIDDEPASNQACVTFGTGAVCANGSCLCSAGDSMCSGTCVDEQTDPSNCGGCGKACAKGGTCVSAVCGCSGTICAGACVNEQTDPNNCNGCGKACASGQVCTAGACACPSGGTSCSGVCVNELTDPNNCGGCGIVCLAGLFCQNRMCVTTLGAPPVPSGAATTSTATHNFAIHNLYLGDTDPTPAFTMDPTAWRTVGYNIDGLVTTASSTNVCTPYNHGTTAQQIDGVGGIDNAYGAIIVPQLGLTGAISQSASNQIAGGSWTTLFDTVGLDGTATQTAIGLGGQVFGGGSYGGTPPLTGAYFSQTDSWPVSALSLQGSTVASGSTISFPAAFVSGGIWVSGAPVTLQINQGLAGNPFQITIHHAIVTFQYASNGAQGLATHGMISGVLETNEFIQALNQTIGGILGGADCAIVATILPLIQGAQDMILDATTGDVSNTAGTACNAISIGVAFDADEIAAPSVVATPVDAGTPAVPCPG